MEKTKPIKNPPKSAKNPKIVVKTKPNQEKSTRFQESYFNPKLHKHNWEPSGKFKEKKKYTYSDAGLGFNIGEPKIINQNNANALIKKTPTHFLEFDFLENNDIIIIIEHCSNCEEHLNHTNHVNNIYKNISKLLQLCINLRYPFIKVYLKPIDINNKSINKLGALEVQLGMKINDNKTITTLFSKLNCNQWPNFNNILNKINSIVPLIDIKCTVYDKEEDVDNNNNSIDNNNNINLNDNNDENNIKIKNDKISLALPSKYENIKINLYSLKNKQIESYCKEASNQLDIAFNPKRKTEIYYEEQKKNDININNNNGFNNQSKISNKLNLTQKLTKPESFMKNQSISNTFNYSIKNNSTTSFFNYSKKTDLIEDLSLVNDLKGKLLSTGYVDKSGILIFENVPYDSYLIEVESSKVFLGCGMPILFQKIYNKNNSQNSANKSTNNYLLNKIFGLKRQIDAFVEVYLFSKNDKNDLSGINLVSGARVVLIKKFFESGDIVSGNVDELELEENKNIQGRYEIVTEAGEAELNVIKKGYENIYKKIKLKNGINKINIELVG
jgi:hypothetical protein